MKKESLYGAFILLLCLWTGLAQAQTRFREMRKASNEYIEDLMKRADEGLSANLAELRKTRQNIKASLRSGQN